LGRHLNRSCISLFAGLIAFYGLNELLYRVSSALLDSHVNLNDVTITAQAGIAPHMMAVILLLLAPFVEEVLFRGVLMQRLPPTFALYFSTVIFALAHGSSAFLWPLFLTGWCLGKVRQATNSLWVSTCCHGIFNALSLFIAVYDL
jgi:membrane protease YdiL (CAAX protease family)